MLNWARLKVLPLAFSIIFILAAVACAGQAAPTDRSGSPSLDSEEVHALIEDAVKVAVEEASVQSGEEVSRQELRELVAEAVAEAVEEASVQSGEEVSRQELGELVAEAVADAVAAASPGSDQIDVAELVSKSVSDAMDARPTPITKAEVEQLIQAEIAPLREELDAASARATEVSKPTIVFSDLNWQSARTQNRIAMFIVEHGYGYPVDLISGETQVLWDNLLDGDSLVTMEVWLPNQQEAWDEAIINGAVIPLGKSLDANWQGFVVPTYLTHQRQLTDLSDIGDQIDLFTAPGAYGRDRKAVLVTCPVGAECHEINQAKIKAYKMEDEVELVVPSSLFALQDSLERAYSEKKPWLGYMWGPSRLSEELDLTILKEPAYSEECWANAKGCAYPTATVLVAVNPSMLNVAPDVVEFLRNWEFTTRRQVLTEKWMNKNNATADEAAVHFLKTWPSVWTSWVPKDVAQRVQAAIAQNVGSAG